MFNRQIVKFVVLTVIFMKAKIISCTTCLRKPHKQSLTQTHTHTHTCRIIVWFQKGELCRQIQPFLFIWLYNRHDKKSLKSKQRKHEYLFGNASLLFLRAGPPLMGLVLTSFEIIHNNNASNTDFCSINQGAVNTFNTHLIWKTISLNV